jgi:hypothetical protein
MRRGEAIHHEIYLSDPSKANPDTMKTVVRCPVVGQFILDAGKMKNE